MLRGVVARHASHVTRRILVSPVAARAESSASTANTRKAAKSRRGAQATRGHREARIRAAVLTGIGELSRQADSQLREALAIVKAGGHRR